MFFGVVFILKTILKIRKHVFYVLAAPTVFTLENIDGESASAQYLFQNIVFFNLSNDANAPLMTLFCYTAKYESAKVSFWSLW